MSEHVWLIKHSCEIVIVKDYGHSTKIVFEDKPTEYFDWFGYDYVVMQVLEPIAEYLGEL